MAHVKLPPVGSVLAPEVPPTPNRKDDHRNNGTNDSSCDQED